MSVSEHFALTTTTCIPGTGAEGVQIVVGGHLGNRTTSYHVEEFVKHNLDANLNTLYSNDFALVIPSRPFVLSAIVGIACLPFRYDQNNNRNELAGQEVSTYGWGPGERERTTPRELKLKVSTMVVCADERGAPGKWNICTYLYPKDSCMVSMSLGICL